MDAVLWPWHDQHLPASAAAAASFKFIMSQLSNLSLVTDAHGSLQRRFVFKSTCAASQSNLQISISRDRVLLLTDVPPMAALLRQKRLR